MSKENFDCQKCGACCSYFHIDEMNNNNSSLFAVPINPKCQSVPLKFGQIERSLRIADSPQDAENENFYVTNKFVKGNETRCLALKGNIGETVECLIYANRPPVCSKFEQHTTKCLEARHYFNL